MVRQAKACWNTNSDFYKAICDARHLTNCTSFKEVVFFFELSRDKNNLRDGNSAGTKML